MATGHRFHRLLQVRVYRWVVQDGLGVHTNVVVDDELQAGQTHALVGQLGKVKSQLGVAHVHHDLGADLGHFAAHHFGHFGLDQAVIDLAGIAFGAGHGHQGAILQKCGGVTAADHGRNAQLTRNDGGVAGTTTTVGDNGAGALHDGFPVGVGHVGHQHVAGFHLVHLRDVRHQTHRAGTNLLANRAAFGQHIACALELVAQLGLALGLALHGFRTRLQDVQVAVSAVLAPLDVHGAAIVLFNHQRVTGQLLHISVGQRVAVAQLGGHVGGLDQLARSSFFFGCGEHHLDQLGAQVAANQRILARLEHGLVHVELVRVHGPLHHGFAQAIAGSDEDHVFKTGFGVDGEHHAGGAQVGAHHALHASGQSHHIVLKALVHAVGDGAVVVQRREHFLHFVQHVVDTDHVQEGFLLTSKRCVRQVFGGGRRAHGERSGVVATLQRDESGADGGFQVCRERLCFHHGANFGADSSQCAHIVHVQRLQLGRNLVGQTFKRQEFSEGVGGGRKAGGHAHALGQLGDHFAERGVLAANDFDVAHTQLLKRHDQSGRFETVRHGRLQS